MGAIGKAAFAEFGDATKLLVSLLGGAVGPLSCGYAKGETEPLEQFGDSLGADAGRLSNHVALEFC